MGARAADWRVGDWRAGERGEWHGGAREWEAQDRDRAPRHLRRYEDVHNLLRRRRLEARAHLPDEPDAGARH